MSRLYRIMLIEDDPALALSICDTIQFGQDPVFRVVPAKSWRIAAPRLASQRFDALVLDLQGSDCVSLATLIHIRSENKHLPIVALVPQKDEKVGKQSLHIGANEYLLKETLERELLRRTLRYTVERARAESAARHCEQRLRDLFENAKDILFTLDAGGKITSLNKSGEDVLGISMNEALQENIRNFVAPEHQEVCRQLMQRVLNGERLQPFEMNLVRKDGRNVVLETSAHLIQCGGKQDCVQGIARDVTERSRLESQVRQSQHFEAIVRLSGGLAHNFNNLLCAISAHADLLSERLHAEDPAANNVQQIRKAVDSAAVLTRQLLAFSCNQVFYPRTLNLNAFVSEAKELLTRLLGEQIIFTISLNAAVGQVFLDPVQLEQVLLNLVLNARDAMPEGGRLKLETSNVILEERHEPDRLPAPAGDYVLLAVTDTGCGMDEDTQNHIFEPFYTTKELGKGTGLGLATVHGIVKQSGGFIRVYSESGIGTIFKIFFPVVESPLPPPRSSKQLRLFGVHRSPAGNDGAGA